MSSAKYRCVCSGLNRLTGERGKWNLNPRQGKKDNISPREVNRPDFGTKSAVSGSQTVLRRGSSGPDQGLHDPLPEPKERLKGLTLCIPGFSLFSGKSLFSLPFNFSQLKFTLPSARIARSTRLERLISEKWLSELPVLPFIGGH